MFIEIKLSSSQLKLTIEDFNPLSTETEVGMCDNGNLYLDNAL